MEYNTNRQSLDQVLLINETLNIKREFLNSKTKNSDDNRNYHLMAKDLIEMGFNLEMIDMCFCFFNIISLERAIELMTKENDVWQHTYIESENKLCIVCNEHSDHINYKISNKTQKMIEERDSISLKSEKSKSLIIAVLNKSNKSKDEIIKLNFEEEEKLEEYLNCRICYLPMKDEKFTLQCNHEYCRECWNYYLLEKINTSKVK
jgi:hypothetical protein